MKPSAVEQSTDALELLDDSHLVTLVDGDVDDKSAHGITFNEAPQREVASPCYEPILQVQKSELTQS